MLFIVLKQRSSYKELSKFDLVEKIFFQIHYGTQLIPSIGFLLKNWWNWHICLQIKIICCHMNCDSLQSARCHH